MKARSLECRGQTPKSPEELFRMKKEAWDEDGTFIVFPEQKTKLKNKHIEAINEMGEILYGKRGGR